jgi:hypothetical protein
MAQHSGATGGERILPQGLVNSKLGFRIDGFEMLQCEGDGAWGRLLFKPNRNKNNTIGAYARVISKVRAKSAYPSPLKSLKIDG